MRKRLNVDHPQAQRETLAVSSDEERVGENRRGLMTAPSALDSGMKNNHNTNLKDAGEELS